jgi:hypothetical protein
MRKIKHSAARHAVIAIHKVVKKAAHHENKALAKLKTVGRKVAEQITKEDLAAHKSRKVAAHQGYLAGRAAIKFAAVLIHKQLVKHVGKKRAGKMIKRIIAKANKHAKNKARKVAGKGKKHSHKAKKGKKAKKTKGKKGKKLVQTAAKGKAQKMAQVMDLMSKA